nr:unnamed protein product [Digitaria exilis]
MKASATATATASACECEIGRLPEEILWAIFARTAPRVACRAAAVSPLFRAAADSDAVWSCFLPRDLPPLAEGELHPPPAPAPSSSKKQLFMRLSDRPVLLADGLVSMWLDRESGAKCYMLSARALGIVWGSTPQYWRWIPLTGSRFAEAAELLDVCWLEFDGKMHTQMLTQNTKYAAYMVFKIADHNYGLGSPIQEAIVEIGEIRSTRQVCLQEGVFSPDTHEHVQFPQERADGWMELAMGEFFNEGADNGEVSIILSAKHGGHWKKGLIVHGIEIRVNPSGSCQSDGSGEPDAHPLNSFYKFVRLWEFKFDVNDLKLRLTRQS